MHIYFFFVPFTIDSDHGRIICKLPHSTSRRNNIFSGTHSPLSRSEKRDWWKLQLARGRPWVLPGSFESLIYIHAVGRQTVGSASRWGELAHAFIRPELKLTRASCVFVFVSSMLALRNQIRVISRDPRVLLLTRSVPPSWNWAADRPTRRLRTLKLINKRASPYFSFQVKKNVTLKKK